MTREVGGEGTLTSTRVLTLVAEILSPGLELISRAAGAVVAPLRVLTVRKLATRHFQGCSTLVNVYKSMGQRVTSQRSAFSQGSSLLPNLTPCCHSDPRHSLGLHPEAVLQLEQAIPEDLTGSSAPLSPLVDTSDVGTVDSGRVADGQEAQCPPPSSEGTLRHNSWDPVPSLQEARFIHSCLSPVLFSFLFLSLMMV